MIPNANNVDETLSRREREKLVHRREIMDAALRVFARKGFFNATLDEISEEAEFSKGALYLYFSNKEDLLYSIMKEKSIVFTEILHDTLQGTSSFRKELRDFFMAYARLSFKEKDFSTVLMGQHAAGFPALSPERAKELQNSHDEFDKIVLQHINRAIEHGELRNMNPEAINGVIQGAIKNMMVIRWNCKTLDELLTGVDLFIDILFNGIGKEKGNKE